MTETTSKPTKTILISVDLSELRVAVLEDGRAVEVLIERRGKGSLAGNIYKGRVDNVLPGMEAAFVDIGLEKNGFLYVDEIVLPDVDTKERRKRRIQELLRPGRASTRATWASSCAPPPRARPARTCTATCASCARSGRRSRRAPRTRRAP